MRRRSPVAQPVWAVTLALLLSASISTAQSAEAAPGSGTDRSVSTTASLARGYEAEHSKTNQFTTQVTDARARRAAPQCSNQRSCTSASAQTTTKQAENVGAGRVKHAHPSAAPQPIPRLSLQPVGCLSAKCLQEAPPKQQRPSRRSRIRFSPSAAMSPTSAPRLPNPTAPVRSATRSPTRPTFRSRNTAKSLTLRGTPSASPLPQQVSAFV